MLKPFLPSTLFPAERNTFWHNVDSILTVTRREVRDQLRDWRIIFPIIALTLLFPGLMNFTARQAVEFVQQHNAPVIIAERLIPFLLMVVGFFPISVSLVIALESFVGEKERRSIEPLLCSPLTDAQLYLGKLLASLIPPLAASYLGIFVYLIGVYLEVGWTPPLTLLIQILSLTTVQAIVMVSGAVVVSTQTTSVRAANLLASFIIIPMAFLIQGEAIVMFWAIYSALWWVIVAQIIIAVLLIRTGLAYFNREEMLGREIDMLNLKWIWARFRHYFTANQPTLKAWWLHALTHDLAQLKIPTLMVLLCIPLGIWVGTQIAAQFPLPAKMISVQNLEKGLPLIANAGFYTPALAGFIWLHNLRVLLIATVLSLFTFGVLGLLVVMLPFVLLTYITINIATAGFPATTFLLALVAPHGVLEIPALIVGAAAILNLGATFTRPAGGRTLGEAFLESLARWARVMVALIIPLFLIAALLETYLTPSVALWLLGN